MDAKEHKSGLLVLKRPQNLSHPDNGPNYGYTWILRTIYFIFAGTERIKQNRNLSTRRVLYRTKAIIYGIRHNGSKKLNKNHSHFTVVIHTERSIFQFFVGPEFVFNETVNICVMEVGQKASVTKSMDSFRIDYVVRFRQKSCYGAFCAANCLLCHNVFLMVTRKLGTFTFGSEFRTNLSISYS